MCRCWNRASGSLKEVFRPEPGQLERALLLPCKTAVLTAKQMFCALPKSSFALCKTALLRSAKQLFCTHQNSSFALIERALLYLSKQLFRGPAEELFCPRPSPSSRLSHLSERRLSGDGPTFDGRLCELGVQCSIESPCTRECAILHDPSLQREAPESSACPMPMSTLSVLAQSFALLSHSFHRRLTFAPILVVPCSPACRRCLDLTDHRLRRTCSSTCSCVCRPSL